MKKRTRKSIEKNLKKYGKMLRDARISWELTQLEVARFCGCSQCVISFIECGLMLPTEELEQALFSLYDI